MPILPVLNRTSPLGVVDRYVVQADQQLGVRAAIGELDRASGTFAVGGRGGLLDALGAFLELLGLDREQVAAGVDADVFQLRRLPAKLLGNFHVALVLPLERGIDLGQRFPGAGVGQGEHRRCVRPQEERAVGHRIEEGAVVAGDDDRHVARQAGDPGFQPRDLGEVEMVCRLVEQQAVRLGDRDMRQQRQALPAAGEFRHAARSQFFRHIEIVEDDVDAPALIFALVRIERGGDGFGEGERQEGRRNLLADITEAHAARAGDVAAGRLHLAGKAAQQGGFAAPVGGDEAEPIAGAGDDGEVGKKRRVERHADGFQADLGHFLKLWFAGGAASADRSARPNKAARRRANQERERETPDRFRSALQASSQGVDRAALTMVTEKRDHAALLCKTG